MVIISEENSWSAWSFLIGVVLAVMIGIGTSSLVPVNSIVKYSPQIYAVLVILGLIVGFTTKVEKKDVQTFLYTSAILVIVSKFGMDSVTGSLIGIGVGSLVSSIFGALLTLFVPATIIVALKNVFSISRV
jgi:hypothetical protein